MKEGISLQDKMVDRNWVMKRKRKRVSSGLDASKEKESISPCLDAPKNKISIKKKPRADGEISHFGDRIKGHDGKRNSADPSSVSRVKAWIKAHTKKDGTPVKDKLKKIETATPSSSSTNVREDALSKVLEKDKHGRLRGMGRGVTISKVSFLQARDKHVLQLKEENSEFRNRIQHLETMVHKLVGNNQALIAKRSDMVVMYGDGPLKAFVRRYGYVHVDSPRSYVMQ